MQPALLEVESLTVMRGQRLLCERLALTLRAGEIWAVLGVNGAGKTTLLHTLAGLLDPAAGRIVLCGTDLRHTARRWVARHLGLLPQYVDDPFPATAFEEVLAGRHPHLPALAWETPADEAFARAALAAVGLAEAENRLTTHMSGGERRRVQLATLITQDAQVWLLDEPTNHLDLTRQVETMRLLQDKAQCGRAVCMALHDLNLAARWCTHALLLFGEGAWLAGRTDEVLTGEHLSRAYAHPLQAHIVAGRQIFLPD
ncbi:MAG: ABC transporter ATP-binding protein [Rhodocyclaceae bacterium]|nr:ABC transporter ATP-binding protein [Rhodocyclaceae bacterium]MBX3667391.1 ABC transporter ATP-binding protein [Rhodocyclaceae bacterium]